MTISAATRAPADVLAESRTVIEPALRTAVDTLSGPLHQMSGYHFGWWDRHGAPVHGGSGKAIRPALTLLCAQALGGDTAAAMPGAVAVELVHNHSLLHDDVIDGDLTRRHRPTVWHVFGTGPAILLGDALLALAADLVADGGHACMTATLAAAVQDLLRGQIADLAFEQRDSVSLDECLAMAAGKTGALFGCACALGAQSAGADRAQLEHLRGFGRRIGLAFQLVDDLLGIWGDPAATGKPVYSDLHSRKKSLPVVAALTSGTDAGYRLADLYADRDADPTEMAELIEQAGGREWTRTQASLSLRLALRDLRLAEPLPGPAAELSALARLIVGRDR